MRIAHRTASRTASKLIYPINVNKILKGGENNDTIYCIRCHYFNRIF